MFLCFICLVRFLDLFSLCGSILLFPAELIYLGVSIPTFFSLKVFSCLPLPSFPVVPQIACFLSLLLFYGRVCGNFVFSNKIRFWGDWWLKKVFLLALGRAHLSPAASNDPKRKLNPQNSEKPEDLKVRTPKTKVMLCLFVLFTMLKSPCTSFRTFSDKRFPVCPTFHA